MEQGFASRVMRECSGVEGMLFVQLSEYTKIHGIARFRRGHLMVGELVLSIAVIF